MRQNLAVIFLFLPIIFLPFIFNSSELAKVVVFKILINVTMGIFWVKFIAQISNFFKFKKKKYLFDNHCSLNKIIGFLVVFYLGWNFLTSFWGEFWPRSLLGNYFRQQGFLTLFYFVIFFLLISFWANRFKKNQLVLFISLGSFLASFYAFYQFLSLSRGGSFLFEIAGTFGNPNFLGGYLVITFPFGFYLAQKMKPFHFLFPFWGLAVIFSGSRMAIFLLLGLACFYLIRFSKKKWLCWLLGLILLGSAWLLNQKEISIYENRSEIWKKGLEAAFARPVAGWGLENFEFAFESALKPEKDIFLKDIRVDKAHNEFLEVLVASGFIGFGLYLAIVLLSLKVVWEKIKNSKEKEWWWAVFLSLVLFVLRSQFNPLSIAEQIFFWFLVGLAASDKLTVKPFFRKNQKILKNIISVIVWLNVIFMIVFNLKHLQADYYFKKGIELERRDKNRAKCFFQKAYLIFPWEEVYRLKKREYNLECSRKLKRQNYLKLTTHKSYSDVTPGSDYAGQEQLRSDLCLNYPK